jgi:hypothetical protein
MTHPTARSGARPETNTWKAGQTSRLTLPARLHIHDHRNSDR